MRKTNELKVLVLQENGFYVAQCLNFDIAAQGKNFEELEKNFADTVMSHIVLALEFDEEPFECLKPTPEFYKNIYKKAQPIQKSLKFPKPTTLKKFNYPKSASLAVA